jgi:hypothetical protein
MGKTAHAVGVPAMANVASDWQKYGNADPRWALCPIVSFFTWKEPRHPFVGSSNIDAFNYAEHSPKFTIAIMAEWGAANDHRAVIYEDKVTGYKARLIGNGAIPHDVQSEVQPQAGCTPFTCVNSGTYGEGNAISSFVCLQWKVRR